MSKAETTLGLQISVKYTTIILNVFAKAEAPGGTVPE